MDKKVLILLLVLFLTLLWFLRFWQVGQKIPFNQQVQIIKVLEEEPKIIGQSQYFHLGPVQIRTGDYPRFGYGDRLKIVGKIDEKGRISFPQIEVLEKEKGNPFFGKIYDLRLFLLAKINQNLAEPYSSLVAGTILGIDQMPYDFKKTLIDSGTLHVVVVSGQNITILAGFVMALAGLLKRRTAVVLTILVIILYTILTGAEPPVVRAAIMGGLAYIAQGLGRQFWSFLALILAAVLMLFYNPLFILNLSFQLSFAATFGIVVLVPRILRLFKNFPPVLAQALAVSTGAYLMTAPIIAYSIGRISLVSIFANLGIYFLVFPLMLLGFVALFALLVLPFLGKILTFFLFVPAFLFVWIVNFFGHLPGSAIVAPKFPLILVFFYYLAIGIWILRVQTQKS